MKGCHKASVEGGQGRLPEVMSASYGCTGALWKERGTPGDSDGESKGAEASERCKQSWCGPVVRPR